MSSSAHGAFPLRTHPVCRQSKTLSTRRSDNAAAKEKTKAKLWAKSSNFSTQTKTALLTSVNSAAPCRITDARSQMEISGHYSKNTIKIIAEHLSTRNSQLHSLLVEPANSINLCSHDSSQMLYLKKLRQTFLNVARTESAD